MRKRLTAVHLRLASPGDVRLIQTIEVWAGERFRSTGLDHIADGAPPSAEALADAVWVRVAEIDDQGVGYAWVELIGGCPHLEQLSVLPEFGGRGVGTALIEAALDWARQRGDDALTLTTFRDVPFNAPLYAKRGFVEVPEHEWTPALRALVAEEADHGLDPAQRVVMRRPTAAGDGTTQ